MQVSSVTLQTLGKGKAGGKGGEEMEGFKETHHECKLFVKYTTVLLLCKSTQHTGVVKAKIHHLQSWASGNAWSGVLGKASAPLTQGTGSGQDTRTTRWMRAHGHTHQQDNAVPDTDKQALLKGETLWVRCEIQLNSRYLIRVVNNSVFPRYPWQQEDS